MYLKSANQHIKYEVADLYIKSSWEVVPVEAWRIVKEEVANENHTVQYDDTSEGLSTHSFILVTKECEKSVS